MDFELVVVQGRSATSTIKLNDGVTTIGRHDTCQLRIKSSQVQPQALRAVREEGAAADQRPEKLERDDRQRKANPGPVRPWNRATN